MFTWIRKLPWDKIIGTYDIDKPKRARTKKGRYRADDKSTKDVNEAWIGGKAPKKKTKKKVYTIKGKRYTLKKRINKRK